jgi:hypothetical protein
VHQVGHYPESHQDAARSTKHKVQRNIFQMAQGRCFWYNIKIVIKNTSFCELPNSTCSEGAQLRSDEAL